MRARAADGHATQEHLKAAARHGHREAIAALQGPTIPDQFWYLFEWLMELDGARQYDMNGPRPTSYVDLNSWARLTDRRLEPHEVSALLMLDRVFVHVLAHPDVKEEK